MHAHQVRRREIVFARVMMMHFISVLQDLNKETKYLELMTPRRRLIWWMCFLLYYEGINTLISVCLFLKTHKHKRDLLCLRGFRRSSCFFASWVLYFDRACYEYGLYSFVWPTGLSIIVCMSGRLSVPAYVFLCPRACAIFSCLSHAVRVGLGRHLSAIDSPQ